MVSRQQQVHRAGRSGLWLVDESAVAPRAAWEPPAVTSAADPPARPVLRLHRPLPTAAFSRRETHLAGFAAATEAARGLGFAPRVRTVGGQLAPLHEDTLIIDVIVAEPDPAAGLRHRFAAHAGAVTSALRRLGVPAGVGAVPGEYCPGEFSVHAEHRVKLAGIAQRVTRWGSLVSTVLVLDRPEPLREVVDRCYRALGVPVDPATVGAVGDYLPGVDRAAVVAVLIEAIRTAVSDPDLSGATASAAPR